MVDLLCKTWKLIFRITELIESGKCPIKTSRKMHRVTFMHTTFIRHSRNIPPPFFLIWYLIRQVLFSSVIRFQGRWRNFMAPGDWAGFHWGELGRSETSHSHRAKSSTNTDGSMTRGRAEDRAPRTAAIKEKVSKRLWRCGQSQSLQSDWSS